MKAGLKKSIIVLAVLLAVVFAALTVANVIQTGGGSIEIREGSIDTEVGALTYKLYVPKGASNAPGVLLLHGYQNDHETCAAYAIELARRGVVVLALDEYGHGSTETGLLARGYVNHAVKVNYGEESEENKTYVKLSGPVRYKLLSNFSNLSFFTDYYSSDDEKNKIIDSSCGGIYGYQFLADLPEVDETRLALSGHSMGTWSSWSVAAYYADTDIAPKATVLQCGELFRETVYDSGAIKFNNVLLLQAKWDEFSYFRDYQNTVGDAQLSSALRLEFLGLSSSDKAEWNTTYGSFSDGTARRMELLYTNHRLTTHHEQGLAVALDWFADALGYVNPIASTEQVAMIKEWLVLLAMLSAVFSILPLLELLLQIPFFKKVRQPLPPRDLIQPKKKWWRNAVITMLIAGATYPFMTQLGQGLLPLPESVFRMPIGNGFLSWYVLLIIVMIVTSIVSFKGSKKKGLTGQFYSMGLSTAEKPDKISWSLFFRSLALVACLIAYLYILVAAAGLFRLDLRFIWPFFRTFSWMRFGQFCLYLPIFALFFVLNNSKIMASMRTEATYKPGIKGFLGSWWRNALLMIGGVLIIVLIEYIPFFLNIGPGADLLFGSTFGGPFMSLLIVFVPQVVVFSVLCTYMYRRTGSAYTGALTVAALACWIVTGGSAFL